MAVGLEAVTMPATAPPSLGTPWAGGLVEHLIAEFASCDAAALVPVDRSGLRRLLCAAVRTEAVRRAIGELGDPGRRSMRDLMSLIDLGEHQRG